MAKNSEEDERLMEQIHQAIGGIPGIEGAGLRRGVVQVYLLDAETDEGKKDLVRSVVARHAPDWSVRFSVTGPLPSPAHPNVLDVEIRLNRELHFRAANVGLSLHGMRAEAPERLMEALRILNLKTPRQLLAHIERHPDGLADELGRGSPAFRPAVGKLAAELEALARKETPS